MRFVFIILMFFMHGCCSLGDTFTEPPIPPPENKAKVYIYRQGEFRGGVRPLYVLIDNEKAVNFCRSGTFFHTDMEPGEHIFVSELGTAPLMLPLIDALILTAIDNALEEEFVIKLNMEEGKTYYLKAVPIWGWWSGSTEIVEQSEEEALQEMIYTRELLPEK